MTAGNFIKAWGVDTRLTEGENRRIVVKDLPRPITIEELRNYFGADGVEGITIFSFLAFVQFKRPLEHTQSLLKNMERWRGKEIKISPFKNFSKDRPRSVSPPAPVAPVQRREHQRHRPPEKSTEKRDKERSLAVYRDRTSSGYRDHPSTSHRERSPDRNRPRSSYRDSERSLTRDHGYSSYRDHRTTRTRSRSRERIKTMRPSSSSANIRPENGTPMSGVRLEPMSETERLWSNFPAQRTFAGEPFAHLRQTPLYPIQQPPHQPVPQFQSVPAFKPTLAQPRMQPQPQLSSPTQPLSIEAAPSNGDTAVLPDRIKLLMDIVRQGNTVRGASVEQIKELEKYFHDAAIEMEGPQQAACHVEPALSQSGDSTCNDSATNGTQEGPSPDEGILQIADRIKNFGS